MAFLVIIHCGFSSFRPWLKIYSRKIREENEARRKIEWEARKPQLAAERAAVAAAMASKVNIAPKPRTKQQQRDASQLQRTNNAADAHLQRMIAEQRGRAAIAAAAAAAAAAASRSETTAAAAAPAGGDKSQQQQLGRGSFELDRTPPVGYSFPQNAHAPTPAGKARMDASAGKAKGFGVWPSEGAAPGMKMASGRPEDRIRGLAGIVVPGAPNGNLTIVAAAAALSKGSAGNPLTVEADSQNQLREFEEAFGGRVGERPEGGAGAPWGAPGAPAMIPAVALNGQDRGNPGQMATAAGGSAAGARSSSVHGALPVVTSNCASAPAGIVNGSHTGVTVGAGSGSGVSEKGVTLSGSLLTWNAVASTEDGILLRHVRELNVTGCNMIIKIAVASTYVWYSSGGGVFPYSFLFVFPNTLVSVALPRCRSLVLCLSPNASRITSAEAISFVTREGLEARFVSWPSSIMERFREAFNKLVMLFQYKVALFVAMQAIHNLGVPIAMLQTSDSSSAGYALGAANSDTPLRRALDMSVSFFSSFFLAKFFFLRSITLGCRVD